ncbi:MAG TPA: hypothetical protein VFI25_14890 [Planctomycetota bacterium]|nr:hypothetical protein [Planctomycetota bacterium]
MIALEQARPGDSLLPHAYRPTVSRKGKEADVAVLPDGRSVVIRNVPAGRWKVTISGSDSAYPGEVALLPGGHARLEVVLP